MIYTQKSNREHSPVAPPHELCSRWILGDAASKDHVVASTQLRHVDVQWARKADHCRVQSRACITDSNAAAS